MKTLHSGEEVVMGRNDLCNANIDIGGRTIIVGFNEPRFKKPQKGIEERNIDSKLNARFVSYFLPAIEVAQMQMRRPRFFVVSGLNMALKWNAETDHHRKVMMASNAIKIDFLQKFFERFFPETFSLVEYIVPQDILKVPEQKFLALWKLIEKRYPREMLDIRFQLTRFLYPRQFNVRTYDELDEAQRERLGEVDASTAFKYAIGHLFAFGDVNFEGNYIHNPMGYLSIGGEAEHFFNVVRKFAFELLREYGELFFDRELVVFENPKIVLRNEYRTPPPYNGMFDSDGLAEVTYENDRDIDFYDTQKKLKGQMAYIYEHLVPQEEYRSFWENYRSRYFALKERYREAYDITSEW